MTRPIFHLAFPVSSIAHQGTALEEGKVVLADPSGNLIELKTYRNFEAVLASDRVRECA
jgi:extradiol dioxygenase family protein